jgi:hypothetical protein
MPLGHAVTVGDQSLHPEAAPMQVRKPAPEQSVAPS